MSAPTAGRGPVVIDTGVFGADLVPGSPLKPLYEPLTGRPTFIAFQTVAELRYGALRRSWGDDRMRRLSASMARAEVVWPGPDLVERCAFPPRVRGGRHPLGHPTTTPTDGSLRPPFALAWPLVSHDAEFRNALGLAVEPMLP